MAKEARKLMAAMVLAAATFTPASVEASADDLTIVVDLFNYAELKDSLVNSAKGEVQFIYAASGVRVIWAETPAALSTHGRALRVSVLLLSKTMEQQAARKASGRAVLGNANRSTSRAWIFWNRIQTVARDHHAVAGELLGKVIAHEMGHLVLPDKSHSARGIMRANLEATDQVLQFTAEQGATIRAMLRADEGNSQLADSH